MRGSDFTFDYVNLLRYKCHQINLKQGGLYTVSPDSLHSGHYNALKMFIFTHYFMQFKFVFCSKQMKKNQTIKVTIIF